MKKANRFSPVFQMRLFNWRVFALLFSSSLLVSLTPVEDVDNTGIIPYRYQAGFQNQKPVFNGLTEVGTLFSPVPINQGMTHDGKYLYVSPDHHTIEKRDIHSFALLASATHRDKIGGLFYDAKRDEILTCSGEYITGGKAFISRIDKNDLSRIEHIDISQYTRHGVNAVVRMGNDIYVGETAVGSDSLQKYWYRFDKDFNFKGEVYSHATKNGSFDWQDATVYKHMIYATDHNGFVHAFKISKNGSLTSLGIHDSSGKYSEGITQKKGTFLIWKHNSGIVSATLK